VTQFGAFGSAEMVRGRLAAYAKAGIDALDLRLEPGPGESKIALLEQVLDLLADL
jgi:hypothetical protein